MSASHMEGGRPILPTPPKFSTEQVTPTETVPGGRWELLGEAGVDGAHLRVADPTYTDQPNMAVEFMSGFGDGGYEVWGRYIDVPPDGEYLAEVRIILITEEALREWKEML